MTTPCDTFKDENGLAYCPYTYVSESERCRVCCGLGVDGDEGWNPAEDEEESYRVESIMETENPIINKIDINLNGYNSNFPSGIAFKRGIKTIDGAYCSTADEFIEYIDEYSASIKANRPTVNVTVDVLDLDLDLIALVLKVKEHVNSIMYGEEVK